MVVGFITTFAISVYHNKLRPGEVCSIQPFMTCDRSLVFSCYPVSSTNKTDRHDVTEILLNVALNAITLILNPNNSFADSVFSGYTKLKEIGKFIPLISLDEGSRNDNYF
jgi:hypothetical protein